MSRTDEHRPCLLTGVLCLALAAACSEPPPPEEAIRAWIAAGEEAAEARDRGTLMDMIAPSYSDARGNDRAAIGQMLRLLFLRQQSVTLLIDIDEIRVFRDTAAEVSLTVGMAGMNNSRFGFSADAYRFELELQRMDDEWQLIGARWGELGEELR